MRPYEPSKTALFHPETADTVFQTGTRPEIIPLAIEAARLAYLRTEESSSELDRLREALGRVGYGNVTPFDDAGSGGQGFGATSGDIVLLAFRGTQSDRITDLITDVQSTFRPWDLMPDSGRVHKGFARTSKGLWDDDVRAWLQGLPKPTATLIVCGHSLGAAIATLLAVPAQVLLQTTETHLVTIGSPRVGDSAFTSRVRDAVKVHRLVNCCDLVTELPPTLEALPFEHVGDATYIDRNGSLEPINDHQQDRALAREDYLREHAFRFGTVEVRDLADHAPANYLRAYWPG